MRFARIGPLWHLAPPDVRAARNPASRRAGPVDEATHAAALRAFRVSRSVGVSLVDQASFAVMRAEGIDQEFAFDQDFATEGFSQA